MDAQTIRVDEKVLRKAEPQLEDGFDWSGLPQGNLVTILSSLSQNLTQYPRRVPGVISIEGRPWRFADLHGFYHQAVQIFHQGLYGLKKGRVGDDAALHILDGGAHTGLASLYWSTRHPRAKVDAFEADPQIYKLLEANVREWKLSGVRAYNAALWSDDDGVRFSSSSDDSGHVSREEGVDVPSRALGDLLRATQYDLVKLDIEGAEFEVIESAAEDLHRASSWVIEIHNFPHREADWSTGRLLDLFHQAGFETTLGDFHSAVWMESDPSLPFEALKNPWYVLTLFAWKNSGLSAERHTKASVASGLQAERGSFEPDAGTPSNGEIVDFGATGADAFRDFRLAGARAAQLKTDESCGLLRKILESNPHFTPAKALVRWLEQKPVFILSFPASGEEWLCHVLADLILQRQGFETGCGLPVDPELIITAADDGHAFQTLPAAGLDTAWMRTHQSPDDISGSILFVHRDPIEMASALTRMGGPDAEPEIIVTDEQLMEKMNEWIRHFNSCRKVQSRSPESIHFMNLDTMRQDGVSEILKAAEFAGLEVSEEMARRALENHSHLKSATTGGRQNVLSAYVREILTSRIHAAGIRLD